VSQAQPLSTFPSPHATATSPAFPHPGKSACGSGYGESGAVGPLGWGFLIMAKRAFGAA